MFLYDVKFNSTFLLAVTFTEKNGVNGVNEYEYEYVLRKLVHFNKTCLL